MNISTEERLDLGHDLGAVSTVNQRGNRMPKISGGVVQNLSDFGFYRSWVIGSRNIKREKIGKLLAFYKARRGTVQRFRFKDWADFSADYNGAEESGYLGVGDGAAVEFQLQKQYTVGDVYSRVITKPVAGTVAVYFDGVVQSSGWSVDTVTGLVTFAAFPVNGVVITADFEFDVPARFTTPNFASKFLAYQDKSISIHNLPALALREV